MNKYQHIENSFSWINKDINLNSLQMITSLNNIQYHSMLKCLMNNS